MPTEGPAWRVVVEEYWRRLFCLDKFETTNRKFAYEVLTDGKAVSIVMRKPKNLFAPREVNLSDYDEVWGIDPGRRAMFTAYSDDGNVKKCTTRQFYEEAKYKSSNATIRGWQSRDPFVFQTICEMPTRKTTSLDALEEHVAFLTPRLDAMMDFHLRKGFRKLKLRRYIFAKRKLEGLCRELTANAGKRTLVGFGDWSNQDSAGIIKKCPAGPVKRFETTLKRFCKVVAVDEFRSSKLHHDCHCALQNQHSHVRCKDGVVRTRKVHSVLFCPNRSCNGMAMDRDVNAARNILSLVKR